MNEDRIKELFSNEEFVRDLFESESYEAAQAKLAAKDIDVTVEELKKIVYLLKKQQAGELTDEELQEVAGGSVMSAICVGLWVAAAVTGGVVACKHC